MNNSCSSKWKIWRVAYSLRASSSTLQTQERRDRCWHLIPSWKKLPKCRVVNSLIRAGLQRELLITHFIFCLENTISGAIADIDQQSSQKGLMSRAKLNQKQANNNSVIQNQPPIRNIFAQRQRYCMVNSSP